MVQMRLGQVLRHDGVVVGEVVDRRRRGGRSALAPTMRSSHECSYSSGPGKERRGTVCTVCALSKSGQRQLCVLACGHAFHMRRH